MPCRRVCENDHCTLVCLKHPLMSTELKALQTILVHEGRMKAKAPYVSLHKRTIPNYLAATLFNVHRKSELCPGLGSAGVASELSGGSSTGR